MAYTTKWSDLISTATLLLKGVGGFTSISAQSCDMVSSAMYTVYPWKDTITTIAANSIPLIDGVQDYDSPINIYRLTKASLWRTDVTPNQVFDLNIQDDCAVDLVKRSHVAISCCSQQQASGTIRLESAVQITPNTQVDFRGEYQLNPVKIVSTSQDVWFKDQYNYVALEGLMYWGYRLSDDARAGSVSINNEGQSTATGQLAVFRNALLEMQRAEDWGANSALYPQDSMGAGREQNLVGIPGWWW